MLFMLLKKAKLLGTSYQLKEHTHELDFSTSQEVLHLIGSVAA